MHTRSEVKAGAVMLISIFLFTFIVITIGKFDDLWKKKQKLEILFSDVQGLKMDDPVQVMGLERGRVLAIETIQFKDESGLILPMVEVQAQVTYNDPLPIDTKISVDRSLTGNTVLKIEPGRASEKPTTGKKWMGIGAVSMTELATKAGIIAKRLDDFIADITDRNVSSSIRTVFTNLKQVSQDVKDVTFSLSQNIPDTGKNLTKSLKSIANISSSLDEVIVGNKGDLSRSIQSIAKITQSLTRVSQNLDQILEKNRDTIHSSLTHVEKATANMKALTREVRWQPWVLLNKPDEVEIRERSIYNSALEFSEGTENLNTTVKQLVQLLHDSEDSKNKAQYQEMLNQIHQSLEKSTALERKLWANLHEKAKK